MFRIWDSNQNLHWLLLRILCIINVGSGVNTGRYIYIYIFIYLFIYCFYWLFQGFPPFKNRFPIKTVGQTFLKPPSSKVEQRCPSRNARTSEGTWCSMGPCGVRWILLDRKCGNDQKDATKTIKIKHHSEM